MKQVRNITTVILLGFTLILPTAVLSFGGFKLPSIPGLSGGGSSTSAEVDTKGLTKQTSRVLSDFAKAFGLFGDAFGLKVDSEMLDKIANCSSEKVCVEGDDADKMVDTSNALKDKAEQMKNNGVKMDAASAAKFSAGLLPYAKGTFKGIGLIKSLKDAVPAIQSQIKSNPIGSIGKLKTMLDIASDIPPMITAFSTSTGAIYDYATFSGIEIPEESGPE